MVYSYCDVGVWWLPYIYRKREEERRREAEHISLTGTTSPKSNRQVSLVPVGAEELPLAVSGRSRHTVDPVTRKPRACDTQSKSKMVKKHHVSGTLMNVSRTFAVRPLQTLGDPRPVAESAQRLASCVSEARIETPDISGLCVTPSPPVSTGRSDLTPDVCESGVCPSEECVSTPVRRPRAGSSRPGSARPSPTGHSRPINSSRNSGLFFLSGAKSMWTPDILIRSVLKCALFSEA